MSNKKEKIKSGRPSIYPWDKWLSKTTTIRASQYSATQHSMCVMIRTNAGKINIGVSVIPNYKTGSIKIIPHL